MDRVVVGRSDCQFLALLIESTMKNQRRITFAFLAEVALVFSAPAGFLIWYVGSHGADGSSVLPHLEVIGLLVLGAAALRGSLWAVGVPSNIARLASCILLSVMLLSIWLYYTLAVGGAHYWGQIISLEVLRAYSGAQILGLLQALGVTTIVAVILIMIPVVITAISVWAWLGRFDWVCSTSALTRPLPLFLISLAALGIVFFRGLEYIGYPPLHHEEPIAMTFFGSWQGSSLQGLRIDRNRAQHLNQLADLERERYFPGSPVEGRNIVLIIVDGLRPDRMAVFDPSLTTTPFLSELLEKQAFGMLGTIHAVCAESACGLLATSSSLYPHEFTTRPFTLNEVLKRSGYELHLLLSGDHVGFYGLKEVYGPHDSYIDGRDFSGYLNDDRELLSFIDGMEKWNGTPTMMQFHLMSAHNLGNRWPESNVFEPAQSYALALTRVPDNALNYYDNGVYQTDLMIRKILTRLETKGYLDEAIVVITADHGEMLGEHGYWLHANTVYEEALRIPFLMIPAWGMQAPQVHRPSFGSQVDIAPTILAELGIPAPAIWSGEPLQEDRQGNVTYFRQSSQVGILERDDNRYLWKYWYDLRTGNEHAYNLTADPKEQRNLVGEVNSTDLDRWRLLAFRTAGSISAAPVAH
jgi:glucan phosphoethanolaminetransferase (alkaline phosphatase superfamily)